MKFYKSMNAENGVSMVEAEGEPWEKNGLTFMLEIPKDITTCDVHEMAGHCSKCVIRHEFGCKLDLCRATEATTGRLIATAKSKSALVRALNRLDYGRVRAAMAVLRDKRKKKNAGGVDKMSVLNPCPICGKQPELSQTDGSTIEYKLFCGVHVSCGDWFPNIRAAEKDWDRRTADQTQPDLYKRTNGDRFRSMTNEELSVALPCPNDMGVAELMCDYGDDKDCCACLLAWLNQPEEDIKWQP